MTKSKLAALVIPLLVTSALTSLAQQTADVPQIENTPRAPSSVPATLGGGDPKLHRVTRIGLMVPDVGFEGLTDPSASQTLGTSLVQLVQAYLQAPNLEVVPLTARVPAGL